MSCSISIRPSTVSTHAIVACAYLLLLTPALAFSNPFSSSHSHGHGGGGSGAGRGQGDPGTGAIPAGPYVHELAPQGLRGRQLADGRLWFVQYYVPWCRGCKRMAGHWDELAEALAPHASDTAIAR